MCMCYVGVYCTCDTLCVCACVYVCVCMCGRQITVRRVRELSCSWCSRPFCSLFSPLHSFSSSFPLIFFSSHPSPSEASDKASLCNRSKRCVFRRLCGNVSADALKANGEILERVFCGARESLLSDSCVFKAHSRPQFYTLKHGFDYTCFVSVCMQETAWVAAVRGRRGAVCENRAQHQALICGQIQNSPSPIGAFTFSCGHLSVSDT